MAERLIGERGIENVSLRQVVTAAKQANNSAVQHYFGSKKGLIHAVYMMRQPKLDAARRRWVELVLEQGSTAAADYLASLVLPIFDVFRPRIRMTYALFAVRLIEEGDLSDLTRTDLVTPTVQDIRRRMRQCLPALPFEVFRERYVMAVRCFLSGFAELARAEANVADIGLFWADRFQAAVSILEAPFPPPPLPAATSAMVSKAMP